MRLGRTGRPQHARQPPRSLSARCAAAALALLAAGTADAAPWRLEDALDVPAWLTLDGSVRARFETLDNQYRRFLSGGDQALVFRSLLHATADTGVGRLGLELLDSRSYLDDDGTPISNGIVDTTDILQAYWELDLGEGPFGIERSSVKLGRMTIDIGGRRLIGRNRFRNTINAFTGVRWRAELPRGVALDAFYTAPVLRKPYEPNKLLDNEFDWDEEESGRRFWGIHLRIPDLVPGASVELFSYGLHEQDKGEVPNPRRRYVEPGLRLFRPPAPGHWDLDLEGTYRYGEQNPSLLGDAPGKLDVRAYMLHAEVGYTLANPWNLRFALQWDLASGDGNPDDENYERYDPVFTVPRRDLGATGIYGPFTRTNISAPAVRVSFRRERMDGQMLIQWTSLENKRDVWLRALLIDPSGQSGTRIGTGFDSRLGYWLAPENLRLELGAAGFWYREFAKNVPDGPDGSRTLYGYLELTAFF
jgi:hypothetical protein